MKLYSGIFLVFPCVGFIIVTGCTSQAPAPQVNTAVRPENLIPATTNATPVITPAVVPPTRPTVDVVKMTPVPDRIQWIWAGSNSSGILTAISE